MDYFGLKIGYVTDGLSFNLPIDRLGKHVMISGQTGTGKSRLAMKLAVKAENYNQNNRIKLLVIDVEGEWSGIIPYLNEKTQYLAVGQNLRINPFDLRDPALIRELMRETVFKGIEKEYSDLSAQMNFVLNDTIAKSKNIAELVHKIKNYHDHKLTALDRTKTALLVRLDPFMRSPLKEIFGCKKSSIDLERLDEQNIVIDLHSLDAKVAYKTELRLIYNTISIHYLRKMLNRGSKSLVSNLFIADEAQLLVPKILHKLVVTESWPATEFATRLRKRGCGLVLITQSPSNIEVDIFKNIGTKISFRLQYLEDIKLISESCGFLDPTEIQFLADRFVRLGQREAIVSTYDREPFLITSAGFEPQNYVPNVIPLEEDESIEEEEEQDKELSPEELDFVNSISEKPYLSRTERKILLKFDAFRYSEIVDSLLKKGIIEKMNVYLGRGRPKTLYQKKGQIPSVKHEFYVNYLVSFFKENGLKATTSQIGPDIVIPKLKTAINVELGTSDIAGNIRLALEDFDFVVTCSDDERVLEKIPKISNNTRKALVWDVPKLFELKKNKDSKKKTKDDSSELKRNVPAVSALG